MRGPGRAIAWAAALIVVALVVVFVVRALLPPAEQKPIERLSFSQSQALPGFDDTTRQVTEAPQLAKFSALADKYSIDLAHFDTALNDNCTGGLGTTIAVTFTDSTTARLRLYDCRGGVAKGTFVSGATALFATWRTEGL
jgi:hypothetical protein